METLVGYVRAYQRGAALTIGELWAIPIMLRVALVDELRRLAEDVLAGEPEPGRGAPLGRPDRGGAARTPHEMIEQVAGARPPGTTSGCRRRSSSSCCSGCAISRRPRRRPGRRCTAPSRRRATRPKRCCAANTSAKRRTSSPSATSSPRCGWCRRATGRSSSNASAWSSGSCRRIRSGAYARMDFPTRDRYRHSVEQLARGAKTVGDRPSPSGRSRSRRKARRAEPQNDRRHHVGYYLISRGRFRLEQDVGYPPTAGERVARFVFRHPALGYLGAIAAAIALILASFLSYAGAARRDRGRSCCWSRRSRCCRSASWRSACSTCWSPRRCRRASSRSSTCAAAFPASDRTMVVVPGDHRHRGAGRTPGRRPRGAVPRQPRSAPALRAADRLPRRAAKHVAPGRRGDARGRPRRRSNDLNARHGADRFFLFHRERRWNPASNAGWDGSASAASSHEFNRLLRGATDTSYVGAASAISRCCRRSATSSRSTPTPSCRSRPAARWSARWRTR